MAFRFGQTDNPPFAAYPPSTSHLDKSRRIAKAVKPRPASTTPPDAADRTGSVASIAELAEGVEGAVSFKSRQFAMYRYRITAKDNKLRIWVEDIKTKKQWDTGDLGLENFVREDSVIPMASFNDYAVCFANCLQNTESSDFACDLTSSEADSQAWVLKMTLKLRVFVTEWTPTYSMLLKPIALEPTDILAAKIRDQEDYIRRLEEELKLLTFKVETPDVSPLVLVTGRISQQVGQNQTIVWKQDSLENAGIVFQPSGVIRITVAATFAVNVTVQNNNSSNNTTTVELLRNDKVESECKDSNANGYVQATPLCHVLSTKVGDELKVVYKGNNHAMDGSKIVIYQLR